MTAWLLLGLSMVASAWIFGFGLYMARTGGNPWKPRRRFGLPIAGLDLSADETRRMGRWMMILAPLSLLFTGAVCFGLFGPVDGVETIQIN